MFLQPHHLHSSLTRLAANLTRKKNKERSMKAGKEENTKDYENRDLQGKKVFLKRLRPRLISKRRLVIWPSMGWPDGVAGLECLQSWSFISDTGALKHQPETENLKQKKTDTSQESLSEKNEHIRYASKN